MSAMAPLSSGSSDSPQQATDISTTVRYTFLIAVRIPLHQSQSFAVNDKALMSLDAAILRPSHLVHISNIHRKRWILNGKSGETPIVNCR